MQYSNRILAAFINPDEAKIHEKLFPATFPSGESSDLSKISGRQSRE